MTAPPPVQAFAAPQTPVVTDPGFVLGGIIVRGGVRMAYLSTRSSSVGVWIGLGEELTGWKMKSIDEAGIVLHNGDRELSFQLYPRGK